jgi:hypothetical protein
LTIVRINTTTAAFANGFGNVYDVLKALNQTHDKIILDFQSATFLNPVSLLPYLALKKQQNYSDRLEFVNLSGQAGSYCTTIRFPNSFNAIDSTIDQFDEFLRGFEVKNYIPMTTFPGNNSTQRDLVITSVGSLLNRKLRNGPARDAVAMLISELTDNIGDHAQTDKGFIVAQNFVDYLDIAIADCGIGILQSFINAGVEGMDSASALNAATRGESTKDQVGRGFGISGTIKMLSKLGGGFLLFSGSAVFIQSNNRPAKIVKDDSAPWNGCLALIRVNTNIASNLIIANFYS